MAALLRLCTSPLTRPPRASPRLVLDRETNKPKGYGFCEFRDAETAASAIRNLNNHPINGRQLLVDSADNDTKPNKGGGYTHPNFRRGRDDLLKRAIEHPTNRAKVIRHIQDCDDAGDPPEADRRPTFFRVRGKPQRKK